MIAYDITEALWGTKVSPETISNLNQKVYGHKEAWRKRPIKGETPYAFLDGIWLKRTKDMGKRSQKVVPLLENLKTKLLNLKDWIPHKTSLGQAIGYALDTLPYIQNYASSPYMTLDNNPIENKIRPFALGRKNWLFANTPAGAHALANWFSLVETAKTNAWKPDRHLNHLLTGFQNSTPAEALLPTNNKPPAD